MVGTILYQFFVFGVPLAVAAAIYGTRWKEGLWGNLLSVFAVLFSSIIAVGWWESLTIFLCNKVNGMLFVADYLVLWLLFLISLLIIGEVTRALSRVKVKFAEPVEKTGNAAMLTLLLALLLGFYYFSLDMSPLGETADATPPSQDTIQLKVFRVLTGGNLSSFTEPKSFDENGEFRMNHFLRKQALMENRLSKEDSMFYEGSIPQRRN